MVTIEVDEDTFKDMLWERVVSYGYDKYYPEWFWYAMFDDLEEGGWMSDPSYNTPAYIVDNIAINGEIKSLEDFQNDYDLEGLSPEEYCEEYGGQIFTDPDDPSDSWVVLNYGL